MSAQAGLLCRLFQRITGLLLNKTDGGRDLNNRLVVTRNNAVNEHLGCCIFNTVFPQYHGVHLYGEKRFSERDLLRTSLPTRCTHAWPSRRCPGRERMAM